MKKLGKALGAVAVAGAIAAGGSAFTASNTVTAGQGAVAGYSSTTVSGVSATAITYTLDGPGANITAINLTLDGDTTTSDIGFAFNSDDLTSCGAGTYDGIGDATAYTCTPAAPVDVTTVTGLHVSAINK
jgi:hypothetical protein